MYSYVFRGGAGKECPTRHLGVLWDLLFGSSKEVNGAKHLKGHENNVNNSNSKNRNNINSSKTGNNSKNTHVRNKSIKANNHTSGRKSPNRNGSDSKHLRPEG